MSDAPERIRIGTDGAVVRSGDAFLNVEGYPVEYVRADLYAALEQDDLREAIEAAYEKSQTRPDCWDCGDIAISRLRALAGRDDALNEEA